MQMTSLLIASVFMLSTAISQTPTTMRIENLEDGWGNPVTYTGEVQNGKPNGLGMFIYPSEKARNYAGSFVDGLPEGKGVIIFNDSSFLWGDWKKGKLNGQGAELNSKGRLYVGQYANNKIEGKGMIIYKDNSIRMGNFINDKEEGRIIYINNTGKIINDVMHKEGQKNGPGYQYEMKDKKLFTGRWENDKWVSTGNVPFSSFLTDKRFIAHYDSLQLSMGTINNDGRYHDTAFYRDNVAGKRYFGKFNNGAFIDGIFVDEKNESIHIGKTNAAGSTGQSTFYKKGVNFGEGNFSNNILTGSSVFFINFEDQRTYYGNVDETGDFTGKGWLTDNFISLSKGDFSTGGFTGNGWRIDESGYCTIGTWYEDELAELTLVIGPDGKHVNLAPTILEKAIIELAKMYQTSYKPIEGEYILEKNPIFYFIDVTNESFFKLLPSSKGDYIVNTDFYVAHVSEMFLTNKEDASMQYQKLCKQLSTMPFTVKSGQPPLKLVTNNAMLPKSKGASMTTFSFSEDANYFFSLAKVMVLQKRDKAGVYHVMLAVGSEEAFKNWLKAD